MYFDFCKSVFPESQPCTKSDFDSIIASETVVRNCGEIKKLVESTPPDADKTTLDKMKKELTRLKAGDKEKHIPSLPGFCFHAHFADGRRSNESAVPSGLVSLDLDAVDNPTEFFEGLKAKAVEMNAALCYITPSTHGLKLVFPVPAGAVSIDHAQELIARELGVGSYLDDSTHDLARLSFAVPADYILLRNDDVLFGDIAIPEGFECNAVPAADEDDDHEVEVPENEADKRKVDQIPMSEIETRICMKYCNAPVPPEGRRNSMVFTVAKLMAPLCDNNADMLLKVVPTYGLPAKEWERTVKNACSRPVSATTRTEIEGIVLELRREKAAEAGNMVFELPLPPTKLPPVFKEYAHVTPDEAKPAQMMSLLPILGFFGSMVKANFADPEDDEDWRTPSFITVISAPPASCKSIITRTYTKMLGSLIEDEKLLLPQLNKYNRTHKEEDLPKQPIYIMPERLSMTSMSQQLELAKNHHLMLFTPEIETLKSCNGSGAWSDLSTVLRKGIDNDEIGQIFMSSESRCCRAQVYLNMLIVAQPETFDQFFNNQTTINGLDTRVIPIELPDDTGCRKIRVKKFSDFEKANIDKVIEQLKSVGKVVEPAQYDEDGNLLKAPVIERQIVSLPRSRKALEQWGRQKQDHFLQNMDNPAEDHYFRRAKMLGFHAAIVAYLCSGCKETREVIDFALWVAEYTMQSQMLMWGARWNKLKEKRQEKRADTIMAISETAHYNLFDELPEEFTTADMQRITADHSRSLRNPSNKIRAWRKNNLIIEIESENKCKRWRKVNSLTKAV